MRRDGPKDWNAVQEKYRIFAAHTDLSYAKHTEDQARVRYHRAFVFTRDKFLEDLATSEQFSSTARRRVAPDKYVQNIAAAVHSCGGRPMLYVKVDEARPFEVSRVNDALLVGTIDQFASVNDLSQYNDAGCEKVCRAALLVDACTGRRQPHDDRLNARQYRWVRQNVGSTCEAGALLAKNVDAFVNIDLR